METTSIDAYDKTLSRAGVAMMCNFKVYFQNNMMRQQEPTDTLCQDATIVYHAFFMSCLLRPVASFYCSPHRQKSSYPSLTHSLLPPAYD